MAGLSYNPVYSFLRGAAAGTIKVLVRLRD
jgi:hypothetical protein